MPELDAVYLDLHDLQSARVWRWLTAIGLVGDIEVRPFSLEVEDPWDCDQPPFGLEMLMLLEQAREHGPEAMVRTLDAAFQRIGPEVESAHAELAVWLAVGAEAGLPLLEYDLEMERLRAEVGLWQAEAREEHGVVRTPTLVFADGTTVYVQLDREVTEPADAKELLDVIHARVAAVGTSSTGR